MKARNMYQSPKTTLQLITPMQVIAVSFGVDPEPGDNIIGG